MDARTCRGEMSPLPLVGLPGNGRDVANHPEAGAEGPEQSWREEGVKNTVITGLKMGGAGVERVRRTKGDGSKRGGIEPLKKRRTDEGEEEW